MPLKDAYCLTFLQLEGLFLGARLRQLAINRLPVLRQLGRGHITLITLMSEDFLKNKKIKTRKESVRKDGEECLPRMH